MSSPLVACENIGKSFGNGETLAWALRGATASFHAGELTMLVGPSGCGKTTLISIIAGLLNRTAGALRVLDVDPQALSSSGAAAFRRRNIGFIFQQYNLVPTLTLAENAAIPLIAEGMGRKAALKKAEELLDRLGVRGRAGNHPRQLSGGQQQRVAIARALIHEPRLILCDEPTAALDAATGRTVMEILRESALSPNRAVIVVTHDARTYEFADRIVEMEDGVVSEVRQTSAVAQGSSAIT